MATHQWQCKYCGKKSSLIVSDNPKPPIFSGKCPNSPDGKHVLIKIK